jgi:RNA polymerase sigma-70 factor (ECF subfamily)
VVSVPEDGEHFEDVELVRRVADRDADALRALYDRYGSTVHGLAYRVVGDRQLAEDCTQEVFVSVWRSASRFDPTRARLSTWLFAIARNTAVDAVRRRMSRPVELLEEDQRADESADTADLVATADQGERVAAAMAELPGPQLEALALAYFEGLSHAEIAERLDVPLGTVKGRIRLALDRLRELAPRYALDAERER